MKRNDNDDSTSNFLYFVSDINIGSIVAWNVYMLMIAVY